jgi:sugar lactone lactonase YvrE
MAAHLAHFHNPRGVAVDRDGNVYVGDTGSDTVRKITAGQVSTLAGSSGQEGYVDATGTAARFHSLFGVAVDESGNVYVADSSNSVIRKVTSAGEVSTVAASVGFYLPDGVAVAASGNVYASSGSTIRRISSAGEAIILAGNDQSLGDDDGVGTAALFFEPKGLSVDGDGNVFVADSQNHSIRKITSARVVTTLAGSAGFLSNAGSVDGTGAAARFSAPVGVALDGGGNVYVADADNSSIRKITSAGVVSTLAGAPRFTGSTDDVGPAARFYNPRAVVVDGSGNVFVADTGNHTIRKITAAGEVSTLAGTAGSAGSLDGPLSTALFNQPYGVAIDASGTLYVADAGNNTIRKITGGVVSTLAGTAGSQGSADGPGNAALFYYPQSLAVDGIGNVFVADTNNHTLRKITSSGQVSTVAGLAGWEENRNGTGTGARFSYPQGVAVDGIGNVYVSGSYYLVRKMSTAGVVTTIGGLAEVVGNEPGVGAVARFFYPTGIAVAANGRVYVADYLNENVSVGIPEPDVTVEAPAGTPLTNGASTVNYGLLAIGAGEVRSFTVRNDGANDLQKLAVTIDGLPTGNAPGDFAVTTPLGATSLAAGESTTVTVTFTASAAGPRSATLHLASNDPDEPSFTVALRGSGADPAAPNAIISTGPAAFTNSTSAGFLFTTAGGAAGVTFEGRLDGGDYAPMTNPFTLSGLAPGAHTYSVRALSAAGYPALNFTTRSWTIDLVPPVITSVPADVVIPTDTLDGEQFVFGAATATDNLGPPTVTYSKVGSLYPVGTTVVIVTATDIAGNITTASFKVTVRLNHLIHTPLLVQGVARVPGHGTVAGPPEDGKLTSFGVPAIDDDGNVAFLAQWTAAGPPQSQGSGLFTPTTCVAQIGGAAGPFGVTFKTLGDPVIARGRIAFLATLAGVPAAKADSVWSGPPASVALVAQAGDTAPEAVAVEGESVAIFAQLAGGTGAQKATAANDYGLWLKDATHPLRLVLREGQVVGTRTINTLTTFAVGAGSPGQGRGWLTQTGSFGPRVLALAFFTGTDKAQAVLGVGFGGGVGVLAQNKPGGPLPDIAGATFASFGLPAINPDGKSAFLASLAVTPGGPATVANARGLFVDYGNPTYTKIARVTETAPASGTTFSLLKDPVLAGDNAIAFPATLKATTTVKGFATTTLWWKTNYGSLQLLAQGGPRPAGKPIPGLPIAAQWTSFPSLAIAADRGPIFSATLLAGKGNVTAASANGVWATDYAGIVRLLFRTGIANAIVAGKTLKSFTLLKTAVGSVGVTRSFNNVGQLVWLATFTDGTTALITTDIP